MCTYIDIVDNNSIDRLEYHQTQGTSHRLYMFACSGLAWSNMEIPDIWYDLLCMRGMARQSHLDFLFYFTYFILSPSYISVKMAFIGVCFIA